MDFEALYNQQLAMIKRIAGNIAHRNHRNADDCEEFVQIVSVRLWENDYAILRKFEGRSSMSTYLTTVIARLYNEWRVSEWGLRMGQMAPVRRSETPRQHGHHAGAVAHARQPDALRGLQHVDDALGGARLDLGAVGVVCSPPSA
jgi:DNA-directed RNA polymerase specialized sigma24 family protein